MHLITGPTTKTISSRKDYENSDLIIGTHSILHNLEKFKNIALIIIDEQHKFGVEQRTNLVDFYTKKYVPNLLTMTATPIRLFEKTKELTLKIPATR